jgi:hypothetical protein
LPPRFLAVPITRSSYFRIKRALTLFLTRGPFFFHEGCTTGRQGEAGAL